MKFALEEASFVVTLCVLFEVGTCGDVDDRRTRRVGNDIQVRAARAEALVQVGELSSARQALEGATLAAPRNPDLRDDPLPELVNFQLATLFGGPIRDDERTFSSSFG